MNLSRQRGGGNNIAAPDEYDSADEDTDSEEREEEDEEEDRDIDDDDDSSGEGIEAKKLRDLEARRQRLEGNRRVAYPYSASRYSSSSSYSKPSTTITPGGASGSSSRPPLQNYDVHEDWGGVPGPRYNIYRDPPPPQRHLSDSTRPGPGLSRQSSHVRLPPQDDPDRRYSGDNGSYMFLFLNCEKKQNGILMEILQYRWVFFFTSFFHINSWWWWWYTYPTSYFEP